MRGELLVASADSDAVDRAVGLLQRDPSLLEAAALAVLQVGWEDRPAESWPRARSVRPGRSWRSSRLR
jgi:hypothetical protein